METRDRLRARATAAALGFLFGSAQWVLACVAGHPEAALCSHPELVRRAPTIVVAEAVKVESHAAHAVCDPWSEGMGVIYSFRVQKSLKGTWKRGEQHSVAGSCPLPIDSLRESRRGPYDAPARARWLGRALNMHDTDCKIHPSFVIGRRYLIMPGEEHIAAWEEVEAEDDAWCRYLETLLSPVGTPPPSPRMPLPAR